MNMIDITDNHIANIMCGTFGQPIVSHTCIFAALNFCYQLQKLYEDNESWPFLNVSGFFRRD